MPVTGPDKLITMTQHDPWYRLADEDQVDSPALLVYPDRILANIREMIRIAGDPGRLVPHVKTHKMGEVVRMQLREGITRFKCATIAEAEMVAEAGGKDILVAYQLNPAKARRLMRLREAFPETIFSSLIDNAASARMLDTLYADEGTRGSVFIDVDNGMHRTGYPATGDLVGFCCDMDQFLHLYLRGLHVYDGHIHIHDFSERKARTLEDFRPVRNALEALRFLGMNRLEVIAGGSPTFPVHAGDPALLLSPGTPLLWDWGYGELLTDEDFLPAAVLLTRTISHPAPGHITTDLGHKSVAAENPLERRVKFLNLEGYRVVSQSEEHLVVKADGPLPAVGDALYAIPYHVCPTVALYDEALVVESGHITGRWQIEGRRRHNRF
jgi:D-serine deaminase-like pyridoxal phosphate-dependent protein